MQQRHLWLTIRTINTDQVVHELWLRGLWTGLGYLIITHNSSLRHIWLWRPVLCNGACALHRWDLFCRINRRVVFMPVWGLFQGGINLEFFCVWKWAKPKFLYSAELYDVMGSEEQGGVSGEGEGMSASTVISKYCTTTGGLNRETFILAQRLGPVMPVLKTANSLAYILNYASHSSYLQYGL